MLLFELFSLVLRTRALLDGESEPAARTGASIGVSWRAFKIQTTNLPIKQRQSNGTAALHWQKKSLSFSHSLTVFTISFNSCLVILIYLKSSRLKSV